MGEEPSLAELAPINAVLRERGWIEGKNLSVERRYVGDRPERLDPAATELVRLGVDAIVTSGTDAALAAKKATSTIPIVMYSVADPVLVGLVNSLPRPGGNITGFCIVSTELDGKRLELLRELVPGVQRVGELFNPRNPYFLAARPVYERTYRSLELEPVFVEVRGEADVETAVALVAKQNVQALVVPADNLLISNAARIMRAALRYRLPTVVENKELLNAGGLVTYTYSAEERQQRYAAYLDKVLRGAKPADLPIEQPTKFEMIVNLRTARALAFSIPKPVLSRADEVIQ